MIVKNTPKLVGLFIILAYCMLFSTATDIKLLSVFLDVISGLSVIGIAILLKPYFIKQFRKTTFVYLALKLIEGTLMIFGGLMFLDESKIKWRNWIYENIHVYIFIAGAFLFYYLLLKTRLLPKFISIWGLVASVCLLLNTGLKLFDVTNPLLDLLLVLIITNEIFLAFWLMFKGFRKN